MHDLVIRGGTIVDGSGEPARRGDVAIDGERIAQSGGTAGPGRREIDADGLLVTPGWVDIHTHYDGQVTWDPYLSPSCWHGVTTVVMGNCGVGFAPAAPDRHDWLIGLMEGVEDIPGTALAEGIRVGVGELPRVPRRPRAHAARPRRGGPGAPRSRARLRDGRARRPQRSTDPRRHRGHGRHRARGPGRGRAGLHDLAHPAPPRRRRRAGAGHLRRRGRGDRHRAGPRPGRRRRLRDGVGPGARGRGALVDAQARPRDRATRHVRVSPESDRPGAVAASARRGRGSGRRGSAAGTPGSGPPHGSAARPREHRTPLPVASELPGAGGVAARRARRAAARPRGAAAHLVGETRHREPGGRLHLLELRQALPPSAIRPTTSPPRSRAWQPSRSARACRRSRWPTT